MNTNISNTEALQNTPPAPTKPKNFNIPNSLSAFRILLVPVVCIALIRESPDFVTAGIALALSALSDMLDGMIARKLNQITELGKWLDPIADKLTLGAVVVSMWYILHDELPVVTPMFAILIGKELVMAVGGSILVHGRDVMVPSQWWGKLGTVIFYICMIGIVAISIFAPDMPRKASIVTALVTIPAVAMVFALVKYIIFGVGILRENRAAAASAE